MDSNVVFIEDSETVADAVKTMVTKGVWSCVAIRDGLPVGVVDEHQIFRNCYGEGLNPETTRLASIMSSPIITIAPDAPIGDALALIVDQDIQRVFVVDNGKIIGRVTHNDILSELLDLMSTLASVTSQRHTKRDRRESS